MGAGPLVVVSPDEAQMHQIVAQVRSAFPGRTTLRLMEAEGPLLDQHIYFLALPPRAPLPPILHRAGSEGASIVWLGARADLPEDVEIFHLDEQDAAAVVPLLRALDSRECSCLGARTGAVNRVGGLFEETTAQHQQLARLRLLARVFETTGEAVLVTDAHAAIVDVNPAFTRITGYTREEVLGRNPRIMSSGRHDRAFYGQMWQSLMATGSWHGEVWDRRKDGVEYPKLLTINAIIGERGVVSHYVGVFNDISDVKETEARLHRLAHHDPLTGLPNRLLFRDRLEQAVAQTLRGPDRMIGVIFIDLDGFKEINDRLGHKAGDSLLIEVALRLCGQLRESDTLARLGGDEFTAILTHLRDLDGAEHVGNKLLEALERPFEIAGKMVRVTASIGISIFPHVASDVDGLLRSADRAMYRAKAAGRNCLFFGEPIQEEAG